MERIDMQLTYKYGNVKYTIEAELEDLFKNNPFELANLMGDFSSFYDVSFSNADLDFMNKIYDSLPAETADSYKSILNTFEKWLYVKQEKTNPAYPDIFMANGHDIYNYTARYGVADFQIRAVLKLDGFLDYRKLLNAVRLSIEAEPVLGCRFVENETPYWKRLDDIDETDFCSFEVVYHLSKAVTNFLESPLDMDKDPMVKVKLIRWGPFDTLCIKLSHACCDGTGTKEYIKLLGEIYCAIDKEYGLYIPKPKQRGRKDQDRLFSALGIENPESLWIPGSDSTTATWPFPWEPSGSKAVRMVVRRLAHGQLYEMSQFAKANGATINDLILTAYYRAMAKIDQPIFDEPMTIPVTFDLRRYLPDRKTEAIRNFSGSETTKLTLIPEEPFKDTQKRVTAMMNEIKAGRPALQSAIGLERIEKMKFSETLAYYKTAFELSNYCFSKCAPVLSNVGTISDKPIRFGRRIVTDAYIAPPVVRPPGLLLLASSYEGVLTLAAGFYEGTVKRQVIETLLETMEDELKLGIRQ